MSAVKWMAMALVGGLCALTIETRAAEPCDRACLTSTLNHVLDGILKRDPKLAPLAETFRYTENANVVVPPEGAWKTATGLGPVQRRYVDAVTGQAVYFGHLEEDGVLNVASLRIKVVDKKVTEGELVVARKADVMFDAAGLTANPPPQGMAKEARSSRQALLAAARSYFDGLHQWNGGLVLAHRGCVRIENGQTVTGRPIQNPAAGDPTVSDCFSGFANFKATIAGVVARRFPVVDEEAGVVFGTAIFNRPHGAKRPADGALYPRNLLTEVFVVENERIRGIWAAMHYMTPDNRNAPGW
jgi:hypothetical protein